MTIKEQFAEAKELIDQSRYEDARTLLRTIKHPTALVWIKKLDEKDNELKSVKRKRKEKISRGRTILLIMVLVTIVLITSCAAYIHLVVNPRSELNSKLYRYCLNIEHEYNGEISSCGDWVDNLPSHRLEIARACYQQSPVLDVPFSQCMIREDILPPGVFRR